jgi:hypothetical protein
VEALTHTDRPHYRWWAQQWPAIDQLESHAAAIDPSIIRLPLSLMRSHPALRRYIAARYPVPIWDLWGYLAPAEGPWPTRRLVALFPRALWEAEPVMLCLDGATDSLHRNTPIELCLYYIRDPDERRWKTSDGLVRLFDLGRRHLWCEHIWRRAGSRPSDWPIPDAAHGYGCPAAPAPELLLPPELPFGRAPQGAIAA